MVAVRSCQLRHHLPAHSDCTISANCLLGLCASQRIVYNTFEFLFSSWLLRTSPPDLHNPSGKNLGTGVQVTLGRGKSGVKPVGVVAVVTGSKSVDDRRT